MKQRNKVGLLISLIILIGIVAIVFFSFATYSKIIKDDVLNISKLTSTNIYSEINNELTKPIFVSLTMANDSFVKQWLQQEDSSQNHEIIDYLWGIRSKYNYHSVFLISAKSLHYFHYNGLFKTISPQDDHDQWYYDFINQDQLYILDVDQDQVDNQRLTIFINCKILDEQGNLLGVAGVGIEMTYVQELLKNFERDYDLEAFLVDETGLIQAHTNPNLIENQNINDLEIYATIGSDLYNKADTINVFNDDNLYNQQYIISHYIEELNWYLIIRKDTSELAQSFNQQLYYDLFIVILVLASVLIIVQRIIIKNDHQMKQLALLDNLGILSNRKDFDQNLKTTLALTDETKDFWSVFLIDLDHFKDVNDTHGHLQGDKILKHVMTLCKTALSDHLITRWGGDEFSGIIYLSGVLAAEKLETLRLEIVNDPLLAKFNITVSIGVTQAIDIDTEDTIVRRADNALYQSKTNGKNQVTLL
ncbi:MULTISPECIES: sensor domain-containing diguanylate cyclase [unclassified Acetobacterium]|jgi:diguanylate cyclase (GGDEF)-like protein|uniref:sensor domain-containing diguanylate cyclase n=1 Tax=unclassified Acetobacterium TaxID=2638182 RepID=UPI000DBEBF01|nr:MULTISPECIES: sensor domain-containing diguanylate cyclase [unclassified Acetobacterium]AWW27185.1 GGDEF domain-containing protein [Acetobacterium sp. KB-1]MDZ5724389.1 diguanylate cyclase [Acetobacterium sp. K1/6]